MTFVQTLRAYVSRHYPTATFEEERSTAGNIWIDVRLNGSLFVIDHKPGHGYGVTSFHRKGGQASIEGYCAGPDRHFTRSADAQRYLAQQLDQADPDRAVRGQAAGASAKRGSRGARGPVARA